MMREPVMWGRFGQPQDTKAPLRGVLFDMDGTLTDSERIWTAALHEMAADLGGQLSPAARVRMLGQSLGRVVEMLHAETGAPGDREATRRSVLGKVEDEMQRGVPWRPGAVELLTAVRRTGLGTALVTSSPRRLVEIAIKDLGPCTFDVIICGDDVSRPKPDPQPYVMALSRLGLAAGDCVAVEDSVPGALAAQRAGLPVLVVPSVEAVPAVAGRTVVTTLRGQSVDSLRSIRDRHRGDAAALAGPVCRVVA
ncbi:HAD family hydrolase [Mycolicibacterium sp.]|uniref:HAD family hydrolase n=2 Tax=Mycolicibacterium sp. TaxID=2320850 RepID=UPI003D136669